MKLGGTWYSPLQTNYVLIRSVTWRGQAAESAGDDLPEFAASRGHMKHTFSPCIQENFHHSSGTRPRHTKCGISGAIKMNSLHSPEHSGSVVRGRVRLAGRAAFSWSVSSGGLSSINMERTHKSKYIDWIRHGTTYWYFHVNQYIFIITNIHWHIELTWGNWSSWGAWLFLVWWLNWRWS